MSTETITIERSKRQCSYNDDVASGKIIDHPIYDWNVLVDGEHRAQFRRGIYKGYDLFDGHGFKIQVHDQRLWNRSDVRAKAAFEDTIRECLGKGRIPTLAQLAEAAAERQRKHEEAEAKQREEERIERIRDAAPDLLAAAERVLAGLNARIDSAQGNAVPVFDGIAELHAAVAKAMSTQSAVMTQDMDR